MAFVIPLLFGASAVAGAILTIIVRGEKKDNRYSILVKRKVVKDGREVIEEDEIFFESYEAMIEAAKQGTALSGVEYQIKSN